MIHLIILIIIFILGIFVFFKTTEPFVGKIMNDPVDINSEGSIDIKNQIVNNKFICKKLFFPKKGDNKQQYIDYIKAKFLKNVPLLFKKKVCLGDTCLVEKDFKNLKAFFPQGTVIPWVPDNFETLEQLNAPKGWMLCDGSDAPNGRRSPDLRDLFVMGKNENGQKSGGNNSFNLETKNLPPHSHGINIAAPGSNCFGPVSKKTDNGDTDANDESKCPLGSPYTKKSKIKKYIQKPEEGEIAYPKFYNVSYLYNNTKGKGQNYPLKSSAEGGKRIEGQKEEVVNCDTKVMDNTPKNVKLVYIMKIDPK